MDYNEAKKTLEDLGINPKEVEKQGEEIVSEIMGRANAMNQNNCISHVSGISETRVKHWNYETDEEETGTLIESTLHTYLVIPDYDLNRQVRWDKIECELQ